METISGSGSSTTGKHEPGGTGCRRLTEYGEAGLERTGGGRGLSARNAHPQTRRRDEKVGGDRRDAAEGSGARTVPQRRSDELGAVDEQVPGPSGRGSSSERASDQEISIGKNLALFGVFFTGEQEKHRGNLASRSRDGGPCCQDR